jgi:hypothetical protein
MGDRSVHAGVIRQSVVVTGDYNTVTLTLADTDATLNLIRKQFQPPERRRRPAAGEPPRELDLLAPEAGKLPLIGRHDLFAELQAWLDDEIDISVHALIGRAGAGKTRVALEFCGAVDTDPNGKGEWIAGFLSPGDLSAIVETLTTRSFAWQHRTLLVIDYAAQCHRALARWLDQLSYERLDTKLRILLLDRQAPEGFGWWHELTSAGPPVRRDLFYAPRPRQLPDLSALEERRAVMAAALQAAREQRSGTAAGPGIPATGADPEFDRCLIQPQFGNPLNLVMAGLIAVDRGPQAALALRRLDAARQIARRELHRLSELARSQQIGSDETRHIVAFNGLAGGLPMAGLRKTVADELGATHRSTDHIGALLTLLQQELPPRTEAAPRPRLATILPDLIGEAAIIEAFTGEPLQEDEAPEAVRRAYQSAREEAAHSLVRLVQDFAYALEDPNATDEEKATGQRVMAWLLNLAEQIDDPEELVPIASALPRHTTVLRKPAAELSHRLAIHFREQAERTGDSLAWLRAAIWFNNLSVRLADLGWREQALAAAEDSVSIYRALADARPDAFLPDLARALCNLAIGLSALGRREEALAAAEESVRLYRSLVGSASSPLALELAISLNQLAATLSNLGRREDALMAAEDAVRIRRELAETNPDAFTPDLAASLNDLGPKLSALGRLEEGLAAAEEAARLYRGLANARPDAFTAALAISVGTLASTLSNLKRREQALLAAEEAVALQRTLAATRPEAFTYYLAVALNNLADIRRDLGRHEAALAAAEEAVGLHRMLTATQPDVFGPNLASSLNNLANTLSDLGQHQRALTASEEAAGLYRALAKARPEAFTPELALTLNNLSNRLSDLGLHDQALQVAEEAIGLYRALADARPDAFADYLAGALTNLAIRLRNTDRREEACGLSEEAVHLYGDLAKTRPEAFVAEFAQSLSVLGILYAETGKPEPGMRTAAEGIRLLFPLFARIPAAVAQIMNELVRSYLARCKEVDSEPDPELLGPVLAIFERLTPREEEGMSGSGNDRSVAAQNITDSSVITGNNNTISTGNTTLLAASATQRSRPMSEHRLSIVLAFTFGVIFIAALIIFVLAIPNPTDQQFEVIRIVIALAAGGVAAVIPGFLNLRLGLGSKLVLRAGGALAVFVVVYFYSPAHWAAPSQGSIHENTSGAK